MLRIGRFHLIRVILAIVFVILFIAIVARRQEENAILHVNVHDIPSFTWTELDEMSEANVSCPVCFGRDACDELRTDISRGALQVSKQAQQLKNLGQTVHGIYRHGKVRFWMKPQPPSPSLIHGFERYVCESVGKF